MEGGRGKEEGGRRKEEGGGRRKEEGGRRKEEGGRRNEEGGRRKEEGGSGYLLHTTVCAFIGALCFSRSFATSILFSLAVRCRGVSPF